jgi:type 2 lantibiotic biosynthesis protein LanM
VDAFYERLSLRAASIDELLSDDFEPLPGQKADADLAARRLAAWCRSSASGDWTLFGRRLERDGLATGQVLSKFASVRRKSSAPQPSWLSDALWIEAALQRNASNTKPFSAPGRSEPYAFEHLFTPLVEQAEALLESDIDAQAFDRLTESARACLRLSLLKKLSALSTPAIYERFVEARKAAATAPPVPQRGVGTARYDQFVTEMKTGGYRSLFAEKPVLLRLMASVTRQWIDTSREFVLRLDADLATIRREILQTNADSRVNRIEGDLSDPHNGGRSVQIISFEDGAQVVYKPKNLRLDAAWHALVERLNGAEPPIELKAVRAIARDGYGWTEFITHDGCTDEQGYARFFRRAGAWLALFHCFVATDMHQENIIAAGDHPVPIDLEMALQATAEEDRTKDPEGQAVDAAMEMVSNSVMMVGMLPAYARSPDNDVFAFGGLTADWNSKIKVKWNDINSDEMRPVKAKEVGTTIPNLPHVDGRYAKFADHIEDFISGFEAYANFLLQRSKNARQGGLFDGFAGVSVRKVIRPTKFYDMLMQRLKNHRSMDDGVVWSAQADFVARLADWDSAADPVWPLHRAERAALLALNVPHFVSPSDGSEIRDATGVSIQTEAISGLDRARARVAELDEQDIAWQITVIRQNLSVLSRSEAKPVKKDVPVERHLPSDTGAAPTRQAFVAEADKIAEELSRYAIRRGPGAAWVGLDWLGDSDVFQLACLGSDLYNGASGIAVFFAAHAAVSGAQASGELARAGMAHLRKTLKSRNAARTARALGIGGATGLGSVVYALTVTAKSLRDDRLLADAHAAAELFTDELVAADKQLDVMGGSAGAVLCLLRLYRDGHSSDVLKRAIKCGEHLMRQPRTGPEGRRVWSGQGSGARALNGMSHGAAGYAYALASLSAASGRDDFAQAASECIAFENSSYDAAHENWPDLRADGAPGWPCQWCHGAPGIGLARIAMAKRGSDSERLITDVRNALAGTERCWPGPVDTLCCGALGNIEFFCEAAGALRRDDLRELAARRLMEVIDTASSTGDFRWNNGNRRFNLGLFRGLAGVGYTALRRVDSSLPNVLIWE